MRRALLIIRLFCRRFFLRNLMLSIRLARLLISIALLRKIAFRMYLLRYLMYLDMFARVIRTSNLYNRGLIFERHRVNAHRPTSTIRG